MIKDKRAEIRPVAKQSLQPIACRCQSLARELANDRKINTENRWHCAGNPA
jgi:hypothetical protein